MEKIINSFFYEVWFSTGEKFWSYDLHEVIEYIRKTKEKYDSFECVLMYRCDYTNSVIISILQIHKLIF